LREWRAGAFGFLIFDHAFDGPDLYGESSFFETMPSRPSLRMALNISALSTVRACHLFSGPFDFVIDDLSRFGESFGWSGERCSGSQPHPVFIVYRHDETRLTREIETKEMVSL